jgi:streptogramin lyase
MHRRGDDEPPAPWEDIDGITEWESWGLGIATGQSADDLLARLGATPVAGPPERVEDSDLLHFDDAVFALMELDGGLVLIGMHARIAGLDVAAAASIGGAYAAAGASGERAGVDRFVAARGGRIARAFDPERDTVGFGPALLEEGGLQPVHTGETGGLALELVARVSGVRPRSHPVLRRSHLVYRLGALPADMPPPVLDDTPRRRWLPAALKPAILPDRIGIPRTGTVFISDDLPDRAHGAEGGTPTVAGHWDVGEDAHASITALESTEDVEAAVEWGRARSETVLIGLARRDYFSAGARRVPDLPVWPPGPDVMAAIERERDLIWHGPVRDWSGFPSAEVEDEIRRSMAEFPSHAPTPFHLPAPEPPPDEGVPTTVTVEASKGAGATATRVAVGGKPIALTALDGAVWFLDAATGALRCIDASTNEVLDVAVVPGAWGVAAGPDALWVGHGGDGLRRVDPATGHADVPVLVEADLSSLLWNDGALLATTTPDPEVLRIDPGSGEIVARSPRQMLFMEGEISLAAGSLWVTDAGMEVLYRLDPRTLAHVGDVALPHVGTGVAGDGEVVWVSCGWETSDGPSSRLCRVDPATERLTMVAELPGSPWQVAVGGGRVWAVLSETGSLARLDPSGDPLVAEVIEGVSTDEIVFGAGSLWAANAAAGLLWRVAPS